MSDVVAWPDVQELLQRLGERAWETNIQLGDHILLKEAARVIRVLATEVQSATRACDEWEQKNGDAPHRSVNLEARIRGNAGLHNRDGGNHGL